MIFLCSELAGQFCFKALFSTSPPTTFRHLCCSALASAFPRSMTQRSHMAFAWVKIDFRILDLDMRRSIYLHPLPTSCEFRINYTIECTQISGPAPIQTCAKKKYSAPFPSFLVQLRRHQLSMTLGVGVGSSSIDRDEGPS